MTERSTDEWRDCLRRVSALERQYAETMTSYWRDQGPPPPKKMKKEIICLREEAKRLLSAALQDIDQRMHEQDRKLNGY